VATDDPAQQARLGEPVEALFSSVTLSGREEQGEPGRLSRKRRASPSRRASGVPQPTKPDVAMVSPLRMSSMADSTDRTSEV